MAGAGGSSGHLDRAVAEVHARVELVALVQVTRVVLVRVERARRARDEDGRLQRDAEHLVERARHRVGGVDAVEQRAVGRREERGAAPRRVGVQPHPLGVAHGADRLQVVEGAEHRRAGGGADEEGHAAGGARGGDGVAERADVHAAARVGGDAAEVVEAEAEHRRPLGEREVRVARDDRDGMTSGELSQK